MSTATINPFPALRFADSAATELADPGAPPPIYDRLTERQRADILSTFTRTEFALSDLPAMHNLSLEDFLDFLDDPRTQATLARLERLSSQRTRLAQSLNQHQAIETLRLITSTYLATESTERPPQSLQAHNTRNRQRETARRAAGSLLRPIPTPPGASPPAPPSRPDRHTQVSVPSPPASRRPCPPTTPLPAAKINPAAPVPSHHNPFNAPSVPRLRCTPLPDTDLSPAAFIPSHPSPSAANLPANQPQRPPKPPPNRTSPTLPPCPPTSSAPSSPPNSPA
ncbi:MAG: hypothetical protein KF678_04750 [Phycisphaeraceae bacterium]|nr:hypothetical protein [Phycisphaeraceae bacterium]